MYQCSGLVTRHQSSLQHTRRTRTTTTRIGNSYSVSGSGVVTDVGGTGTADLNVGGLGTLTNGTGGSIPTATQSTSGNAFSFTILLLQVMQIMELELTQLHIPQVVQVTIVVVVLLVQLITHTLTITGTSQGAGTSVNAQFVTELTIID